MAYILDFRAKSPLVPDFLGLIFGSTVFNEFRLNIFGTSIIVNVLGFFNSGQIGFLVN